MRLLLQHPQAVGERGNAVPAQLSVIAETAADHMHMRIVETGNDPPPFQVDPPRLVIGRSEQLFPACGCYASIGYGNSRDLRMGTVESRDFPIIQNQFRCVHIDRPPLQAITASV